MIGEGDQLGWLFRFERNIRATIKANALEEEEASMSDELTTSSDSDSEASSSDTSSTPKPDSDEPVSKTRTSKHPKPLVSTFLSQLHPPLLWVPHSLSLSSDRFEPAFQPSEPWTSDVERELQEQLDDEEEIEDAQMLLDKNDEKDLWARVREEYEQEETRRALLPAHRRLAPPPAEGGEPVKRAVGRPKGSATKKRKRAVERVDEEAEGEADDEGDVEEEAGGSDSDDYVDESATKKRKLDKPKPKLKPRQKNKLPEPVDMRFREKGGRIKSTVYIDPDADV